MRMKAAFALLVSFAALSACSQNQPGSASPSGKTIAVANADFEQASGDGTIPGWTSMMHADPGAFLVRVDADGAHQGHGSLHITRVRDEPYGMVAQDIDVTPYAGKTLELSAMSKTRDVGAKGWKLLLNGNAPGTMKYSTALTGTQDWQRQSVSLKVTPFVHKLTIAAILLDAGDGWLDEVELKVVD
jgi:hypothetical protein